MTIFMLCLQIFSFRILDVSLGVVRTIMLVKRRSLFASMIGFFEVLIWFLIVRNALTTVDGGIYVALAYAAGFATGTYLGGFLAKKFIRLKMNVQVITSNRNEDMIKAVRAGGFPLTVIEAAGSGNEKSERYLFFIEINSYDFNRLKELILSLDPHSFIFVNELTNAINGHFYDKKLFHEKKIK